MRAQITDELRKKVILLDKVQSGSDGKHHHYEVSGGKYDQYLGTNNKRPGPAMEETKAERDMLVLRKDKNRKGEEAAGFKFSSPKVNLKINDWRKMNSIEQASQSGVFYIGQPFGAFVLKGTSEVVASHFATKFLQKMLIPVPEMRIIPFNETEFKFMMHELDRLCD